MAELSPAIERPVGRIEQPGIAALGGKQHQLTGGDERLSCSAVRRH
jgi:hypothetical protein